MFIGLRIKQLAESRKMTATQLASSLGITRPAVSAIYEKEEVNSAILRKCAKIFNVPISYFFEEDEQLPIRQEIVEEIGQRLQTKGIPLLPIEAVAGILSGNDSQVMGYECEYYDIPSLRSADFLIRVTGDSMEPKYLSGDIVACRRLPIDTFFEWNRVYVIGSEQGVLIKRVRKGEDSQHISLVSENKEYTPFEIPLSKVHSLAIVVGVIRAE